MRGSGEGGFTSERYPECAPVTSAVSAFRQHRANLFWGYPFINVVRAYQGAAPIWGKPPGFEDKSPCCEKCDLSRS